MSYLSHASTVMNSIGCLVSLATTCVLIAEGLFASASTIPEPLHAAIFLRSKRDDGRAMTFSGFYPYGGMTAFATSGDWGQWQKGRGNRRPSTYNEWNNNNNPAQGGWSNTPIPPQTEYEESSPEVNESSWKDDPHNGHEVNKEEERPVTKRPKKKPTNHKDKSSEEEDDDSSVVRGNSGGNAAASFNAWFPILLGMFPQEENGNGYKSSSRKTPPQTTIVANSVSHGPGGVASSHAVAYGGLPEQYRHQH